MTNSMEKACVKTLWSLREFGPLNWWCDPVVWECFGNGWVKRVTTRDSDCWDITEKGEEFFQEKRAEHGV